ncbi:hypothetical protein ACQBAU_09205 [Propionibacteriaceae bacterium Y2011]|uniref:hypothetical protein n=1 Tax=Microlunatus sp. Y2014 TaxID=3418488 RepID=UPI003B4D118D
MSAGHRLRSLLRRLAGPMAAAVVVAGCAPAANSELPREVRGAEVHAERQRATATADEYLLQATNSSPMQANLDGCRDLRPEHSGFLWACSVIRATTVTGGDVRVALDEQHQRVRALGCSAYPGIQTRKTRLDEGLPVSMLYDVTYSCPDGVVIVIRFSEPTDSGLPQKLDLTTVSPGPGPANVVSEQKFSEQTVRTLTGDTTQQAVLVVAVQKDYWAMPAE